MRQSNQPLDGAFRAAYTLLDHARACMWQLLQQYIIYTTLISQPILTQFAHFVETRVFRLCHMLARKRSALPRLWPSRTIL
jgi:hypothetical protein